MTERLADVVARIGSVRQLDQVMVAMRGIAAARAREAQNRLVPIRAYAEATAIAVVLLVISFTLLIAINLVERWSKRYYA